MLFHQIEIYYNQDTSAQYYNGNGSGNHFVTLVGWDDNYSRDNFKIKPDGDGAWICKNSWGTEWGENGYFYISYYDTAFARFAESVGYIINNVENYTTVYQYDIGDFDKYFKDNGQIISFANTYEAIDNELISAVGTYFENADEDYTIKVYVNSALAYSQTGKSTHGGFETIKLDKQIVVNAGIEFSVEIQAKALPLLEDTRLYFEKGKSMAYYADKTVDDIGKLGQAVCIKVYTVKTNITGKNNSKYYSKSNLTIKSNCNGKTISIVKDGKSIGSAIVKEGEASFNFSLEPGAYSIITSYDEGDIVEGFEIMNTIVVDDSVKTAYKAPLTIEAAFYDDDGIELFGSDITVILDGKNFTKTIDDIDGILYLSVNGLSVGNHILVLQNPETEEESTTTITVVPLSFASSKSFMISHEFAGSKFPVGSSAIKIDGSFTIALAMATRCCSPPDNSFGYDLYFCANPTRESAAGTFFLMTRLGVSVTRSANAIFSYTFLSFNKRKS